MKRLLPFFTTVLLSFPAFAQYYMNVFPKNGQKISYIIADLDSINFSDQSESSDEYEYVDLGLSVNWATHNVGAERYVEDYGDYYAWGETEPKNDYSWNTYKYSNSVGFITKYCTNGIMGYNGYIDNKTTLDPIDDVAHVKWGGDWRMPTNAELNELKRNCIWEWTTQNGINGYKVTSKIPGYTDRSLFLPAAGIYGDNTNPSGSSLAYWTSSIYSNDPSVAQNLYYHTVGNDAMIYAPRYKGQSVRPVKPSEEWISELIYIINKQTITIGELEKDTLFITPYKGSVVVSDIISVSVQWHSDNPSVATINDKGVVTGVSEGTANITASFQNNSVTCIVIVKPAENGYIYVDLGLSVKWATSNIGAAMPIAYGDYYAWGETETKTDYTWSTYKWCNGSYNTQTKYNTNSSYGMVDNKTTLDPEDDVAHVKWGGNWRMPTKAEQDELRTNCTWTWTTLNGVNGYRVTSNKTGYTDRSIFLPAGGYRDDKEIVGVGDRGYYWTSSLKGVSPYIPACISFDSDYMWFEGGRSIGFSIRPVCSSKEWLSSVNINIFEEYKTLLVGSNAMVGIIKQGNRLLDNALVSWSSDNPLVAIVNEEGIVTAISAGTAHITASVQTLSAQCAITVIEESNVEPKYVDMGLSVKWATFNVGSLWPEDFGFYYAWGETETKTDYSCSTYKWCNGSSSTLNKYNTSSKYGTVDNKTILDSEDDVAHVMWGGSWRMPTLLELDELQFNCTWTWYSHGNTEFGGVAGYKVTSNVPGYTDRFIFLPVAGDRYNTGLDNVGSNGSYWSSSLVTDSPGYAYSFSFGSGTVCTGISSRSGGFSVRPVCP